MSTDLDGQAATITGTESGLGRTHAAKAARRNTRAAANSIANMNNTGGFTLLPNFSSACANAWERHEQ